MISISEDESIMMLHDFTTFVINNADENDKVIIVDYVSQLLAMAFGGGDMSTDEMIDFLLSDPETLALIVAYLIKYMEVSDLSAEDIDKLLKTLGLDSLDEMFTVNVKGVDIVGLSCLLDYIKKQLTDNDDDWIIANVLLPLLKKWKFDDLDIDITDFWNKVNSKVKKINTSGGTSNAKAKTGSIRDFSLTVYNALMGAIRKIENMSFSSVSSWASYSSEEWYSSLFVSTAIKGFSAYFNKLTQTNSKCKTKIETIFSNVSQADTNGGNRIKQTTSALQTLKVNLNDCANGIG